jgi:hypothetical protein
MDRRNFLRFLGLGAAAAVTAPIIKPKAFFSFYGTGVRLEPLWTPADKLILGMDYAADGIGTWVARLGKWSSGLVLFGQTTTLPDGTTFGADARGGCISTWRFVTDVETQGITIIHEPSIT